MHCAIYVRVSTSDQQPENQLQELRVYASARGWTSTEYIDRGISGSTDRRPALDQMVADARRRRFDVLVVWRLDRLGRSLRHLVTLLEEFTSLGVGFTSLNEGIDFGTPAGRLQLHVLAALADYAKRVIMRSFQFALRQ
jgi:DNA invertase Pin-like site-specific DNA recombinase